MKHYLMETAQVLAGAGSRSGGLTNEETAVWFAANGRNKLTDGKKDSIVKQFFKQMADPMILILLAAVTSRVLHGAERDGRQFRHHRRHDRGWAAHLRQHPQGDSVPARLEHGRGPRHLRRDVARLHHP